MRKKIFCALLIVLAVCAFVGTAVASSGSRTAELTYRNIKITLNGETITPKDANGNVVEPFIIDGTTYLPVRAVSNALGLEVSWDNATSTVSLKQPNMVTSGTVLYDDQYVTIAFDGIKDSEYSWYPCDAVFKVTNKTDWTLTIQCDSIAFDGISYSASCSDEVAPYSTGSVRCNADEKIPADVTTCSGTFAIIDWEREDGPLEGSSYKATWANK